LADLPTLAFADTAAWLAWLEKHHASVGVWIRFAKEGSGEASVSHDEALDAAIAYGWIDGQNKSLGAAHYVQRFIPRTARSKWSVINRAKAQALIAAGRMQPSGLKEVEAAKADGRWAAAYDGPRLIQVSDDLRAAPIPRRRPSSSASTARTATPSSTASTTPSCRPPARAGSRPSWRCWPRGRRCIRGWGRTGRAFPSPLRGGVRGAVFHRPLEGFAGAV
jgi:hypothetical protein